MKKEWLVFRIFSTIYQKYWNLATFYPKTIILNFKYPQIFDNIINNMGIEEFQNNFLYIISSKPK